MQSQFHLEWVRLSFHCPISLQEYIGMSRADRQSLQMELTRWILETNETSVDSEGTETVTSASPRTMRRVGL